MDRQRPMGGGGGNKTNIDYGANKILNFPKLILFLFNFDKT